MLGGGGWGEGWGEGLSPTHDVHEAHAAHFLEGWDGEGDSRRAGPEGTHHNATCTMLPSWVCNLQDQFTSAESDGMEEYRQDDHTHGDADSGPLTGQRMVGEGEGEEGGQAFGIQACTFCAHPFQQFQYWSCSSCVRQNVRLAHPSEIMQHPVQPTCSETCHVQHWPMPFVLSKCKVCISDQKCTVKAAYIIAAAILTTLCDRVQMHMHQAYSSTKELERSGVTARCRTLVADMNTS